jgi:predicted nucleotidyltransferase
MGTVLNLQERKTARVQHIRRGFAELRERLAEYARVHGGRFLICGSAARGRFHYESDIDVLVDFDTAGTAPALALVEAECVRLGRHLALIKRVAANLPGRRPAILSASLADAADETRRFRHRAAHNYGSFRLGEVSPTMAAAKLLSVDLQREIAVFKDTIEPTIARAHDE